MPTASPGLTAIALAGGAEPPRPMPDLAGASLCAALFPPGPRPAIAYFLDPQCPICRRMLPDVVAAAGEAGAPLRVQLLTGLGPASDIAARAILAARVQGREADMRDRLSRAMLVTDLNYVRAAAAAIGADPDRLVADMRAPEVSVELRQAADLARLFGLRGTPATVIGRTLVEGRMSRAEMASLLTTEARESPGPCG